jgi:hypothetical protein
MRFAVIAAVILLSSCASDRLGLAPPPGVDFSGNWKLNEADSDDPMHLTQSSSNPASAGSAGTGGTGGSGGRGGRGGAGGNNLGNPALMGPATPSFGAVGEGLRWPGKLLEIKQVDGVVAFTSEGKNRICQPTDMEKKPRHHGDSDRDRDALPAARDIPPPRCGWVDKTLILESRDPDTRPPFEERYSISEDGKRLVELVGFKGGRSNGFTMSRVWDRTP